MRMLWMNPYQLQLRESRPPRSLLRQIRVSHSRWLMERLTRRASILATALRYIPVSGRRQLVSGKLRSGA
jgi:hypothetical protein